MDIERLIQDSNHNIEYLAECLSDISDAQSKRIPKEGKWCIHQILEHLYITETAVFELCAVQGKHTVRSPFEKIISIRNYFGDHSKEYTSMDMLVPCDSDKTCADFLDHIKKIRVQLIEEDETRAWSEEYTAFKHPLTGYMTRYEWVYFNIYHIDRHTHQIRSLKLLPDLPII